MDTTIHEFVVSKRDFLDAQRLHRKNRPWAAFWYYFWFFGVPALGAGVSLYWVLLWLRYGWAAVSGLAFSAGLGLYFAILFLLCRWWQIHKLWNQSQPKKYRGQPVTLQFDGEMLISARPGESEGRFFWKTVEDYAEDDRIGLVYVRRKLFLFVPKRAMGEGEWTRLRELALPHKVKGK